MSISKPTVKIFWVISRVIYIIMVVYQEIILDIFRIIIYKTLKDITIINSLHIISFRPFPIVKTCLN